MSFLGIFILVVVVLGTAFIWAEVDEALKDMKRWKGIKAEREKSRHSNTYLNTDYD